MLLNGKTISLNIPTTITGKISRIIYSKGCWASVSCTGNYGTFTAVGTMFDIQSGLKYRFDGCWVLNEKYGIQFQVDSCTCISVSRERVISFLSSGFVKGVGVKMAYRIYDKFGTDTYNVIENHPERLAEVKGVSPRIAQQIHEYYAKSQVFRNLREYLPPEISDGKTTLLYHKYGDKSIEVLKENPYQIIKDLDGIGFITADKMAKALGISRDDPRRINAAIVYCLQKGTGEGHCYLRSDELQNSLQQFLGENVSVECVAHEIRKLTLEDEIKVDEDGAIYYIPLYKAETCVAKKIANMLGSVPSCRMEKSTIDYAIHSIEYETGYELDTLQKSAVRMVFGNCLSIITGGPGTGKTTITKSIIKAWLEEYPSDTIALAAPTGKAARRMAEVTGCPATTIHRLLSFVPELFMFKYNEDAPLPFDLVIIDEASMLDISMAYNLLRSIKKTARVVLIGDIDQLPPVGPGNFFRDLVTSLRVPTTKLQLSFRQSGKIAVNAQKINSGEGPYAYTQDADSFVFLNKPKSAMQSTVISEYMEMVKKYGVKNCCILSPMHKSQTGTNLLNDIVRNKLNPAEKTKVIPTPGGEYRVGDRVICTKNMWYKSVANGEMGYIASYDEGVITVTYDSDITAEYDETSFAQIHALAYAITIHKSQGSEYKGVVIALNSEHWYMAQRNLLYTAVTRAKEKVVIVGDVKTLTRAAENVKPVTRNTKLKHRISLESVV